VAWLDFQQPPFKYDAVTWSLPIKKLLQIFVAAVYKTEQETMPYIRLFKRYPDIDRAIKETRNSSGYKTIFSA